MPSEKYKKVQSFSFSNRRKIRKFGKDGNEDVINIFIK